VKSRKDSLEIYQQQNRPDLAVKESDAIAKHMLNLYRDETHRSQLIEAGKIQASKFNWDRAAEQLWKNICRVAGKDS
jgi:uncharacterized protein YqeY